MYNKYNKVVIQTLSKAVNLQEMQEEQQSIEET